MSPFYNSVRRAIDFFYSCSFLHVRTDMLFVIAESFKEWPNSAVQDSISSPSIFSESSFSLAPVSFDSGSIFEDFFCF